MSNEKYRTATWQENTLKSLYHAFAVSEEDGLKRLLNLAFELYFAQPSFLEKLYDTIHTIKAEGIYHISQQTVEWVTFWQSYDFKDRQKTLQNRDTLSSLLEKEWLSPENLGRLYWHLGLLENNLGNHSAAATFSEKSIRLLPNLAGAYRQLAYAYARLDRAEDALPVAQKALELQPDSVWSFNTLGLVYSQLGKTEEAITTYQKAIECDPDVLYPHKALGDLYKEAGRFDEAIACYQKAIDVDPAFPWTYLRLGWIYWQLERLEEAISAYEKAIEIEPSVEWGYLGLGLVYSVSGRNEDAMTAHKKAIEVKPDFPHSYSALGYLQLKQGNFTEAMTYLNKAIELDRDNESNAPLLMGITYFQMEKNSDAISLFQSLLEQYSRDSFLNRYRKITILAGLERMAEALALLQETCEHYTIWPRAPKSLLDQWNLLATSPRPPAGIAGFIEKAREILSKSKSGDQSPG